MAGKAQGMKVWRKVITMIAFAFALVIFAEGFRTVVHAESGTTNTGVNMRKTPSKNGDLVKKLEKGTTVELGDLVDGKDGDGKKWYAVTVGSDKGYIRSDLITKGTTNTGVSDGGSSGVVEEVTPVGATVAGSNTVRVRTSASTTTSNNILATVAKGTDVTVIGKVVGEDKKTWYQVRLMVEGSEKVGYIRSDYLVISGEIRPIDSTGTETSTPVDNDPTIPDDTEPKKDTETVTPSKRYETKLINEEWWIQDLEKNEQYKIEQLFSAANEYKSLYEAANKKAKSRKGWLIFFIIVAVLACGGAGYLFYRLKEAKEAAFIASIENNTPRRTSDRPARNQANGREKPAIRDGLEGRSREDGRPANGQRSTGNRQPGQRPNGQPGQRPAGAQQGQRPAGAQQGQRPNGQPGQRPADAQGQRPMNGQPGQRPVDAQGQRPMGGQPQQRPVDGQGQRPMNGQPGQRPMDAQGQRPMNGQPGQRPMDAQGQRPMGGQPQQRPVNGPQGQPQAAPNRPKNFVQDNDDMEYEFLNWDSDE
ncbi:MAG: hypothetical protein E7295_01910 [Lachnospiraceae bacterium]|jgi:uncharacterized protein YgiM (DUF1202 family)|nr:hypothetical protein [Lachnospiraceae bacterium]